jgi:hypothetical protein
MSCILWMCSLVWVAKSLVIKSYVSNYLPHLLLVRENGTYGGEGYCVYPAKAGLGQGYIAGCRTKSRSVRIRTCKQHLVVNNQVVAWPLSCLFFQ